MILTSTGQTVITESLISNSPIILANIAVGDGNGSPVNPTESWTTLVHEVYRAPISQHSIISGAKNTVQMVCVIPSDVGGFTIREVGVYDNSNNLIGVGSSYEIEKPDPELGLAINLTIRCTLIVTNKVAITFTTNPDYELIKTDVTNITNDLIAVHNTDTEAHANLSLPTGGEDGDLLVKYGSVSREAVWRSQTQVTGLIRADENGDLYIF